MGFPDAQKLLEHARREVNAGESFFEFRLDYLPAPEQGVAVIRKFLAAHPDCCILATCRRHQNHGKFNGSVEDQIRILDAALDAGARAVDIEIESAENAVPRLEVLRGKGQLMLSYHNYDGTPSPETVLRRMLRIPADGYKIVTTARKPSDNSRILALTKSHPRTPLVVLAMGETGFPTRVLAPAWGGMFTYAAPNASEGTASGQVSARVLRHLYRAEKFSRAAKIYGVIADPVRHSISPAVHNRAFQSHRLDAVYLAVSGPACPVEGFFHPGRIAADRRIQRHHSAQAEDRPLSRRGRSSGAAHRRRQHRVEKSREVAGREHRRRCRDHSFVAQAASIEILGAGGRQWRGRSQRGICAGGQRRESLHRRPQSGPRAVAGPGLRRRVPAARTDERPQVRRPGPRHAAWNVPVIRKPVSFPDAIPAELVFDMVYNPLETTLLRHAASQGSTVISGLQMFLEQATRQFEIWTGGTAPRSVMEKAALEALAPPVG